jgi:hypothetical protein
MKTNVPPMISSTKSTICGPTNDPRINDKKKMPDKSFNRYPVETFIIMDSVSTVANRQTR